MSTKGSQEHERINQILLGALERPALNWLAKHMPAWVTPDMLTLLGLAATVLTAVSYVLTNYNPLFLFLACLGIVINWFGDSLDGTLARYRKIERPRYGFFIDHAIDGIGEVLVLFGVGLSPYVDFRVACFTLVGYMLMSNLVYITTYVSGKFKISYFGLGPTEARLILILANILVFFIGNPLISTQFGIVSLYSIIIGVVGVLLYLVYISTTITTGRQLAQLDGEKIKEKEKSKRKKNIPFYVRD